MYPKNYFESNKLEIEGGFCFVLMPFTKEMDQVYSTISNTLKGDGLNLKCRREDEFLTGGSIVESVLKNISSAEFIIADLTHNSPNVFYELGIVHTLKNSDNVILLTQDINKIPFDIRLHRYIDYSLTDEGLEILCEKLTKFFNEKFKAANRFSIKAGQTFTFTPGMLGKDRSIYNFEIEWIWVGPDMAKITMIEIRNSPSQGLSRKEITKSFKKKESMTYGKGGLKLILENTIDEEIAFFRVVEIK